MATKDEILGVSNEELGVRSVKDTKTTESTTSNGSAELGAVDSYEKLYKELNPYTPPTKEELEKEKKKQRRDEIFAAIGDGVMALSNLFFATKGAPNMYNGKNTMSERTRVRYDKLLKDREEKNTAYFTGMMKAKQADADNAHRERSWQRQLGLDEKEQQRYNDEIKHRNEREKIADDRYTSEWEFKKERAKIADEQWEKSFNESKRQHNQNYNLGKKRISAAGGSKSKVNANKSRGRKFVFRNGEEEPIGIYENVWKGSMQGVYDVLAEDMREAHQKDKQNNPRVPNHKSAQEKEDFVKQNWHKSPRAIEYMRVLSGIDPAEIASKSYEVYYEDEDVEEYTPGGGGDGIIDYTPGNN